VISGSFQGPVAAFRLNRDAVYGLLNFETAVLDIAISQLETLRDQSQRTWARALNLKVEEHTVPAHLNVQKTIDVLQNIRDHGSLKPRYEVMVNQCVVLLVSYFGAAVKDLFREAVSHALQSRRHKKVLAYELKISADELQGLERPIEFIADYIGSGSDISFQDMKSIARAMAEFFGVTLEKDEIVNDIILAHACRHAIVHHGMVMDNKLVKQVAGAHPRLLKPEVELGVEIQFSPTEVHEAGRAMSQYVESLATKLEEASGGLAA